MSAAALPDTRAPFDRALLLAVPATLFMLLLFIYPFIYGLLLSFTPVEGGWLANYRKFFTTDNLWPTIWTTLKLALPATLINVGFALPIAYKMRVKSRYQRWITTILVVPITLGTSFPSGFRYVDTQDAAILIDLDEVASVRRVEEDQFTVVAHARSPSHRDFRYRTI